MRHLLITIVIMLSCQTGPSFADAEGTALAEKLYDREDGKDASTHSLMILSKGGNKQRYRTLYSYRLDNENGETWSLTRFTEPADINGTSLLTHDRPGGETDQWIYLPALDRTRRISSSRKGGRFVGSDFYYEDLSKRDVGKDRHRILGTAKIGKITTTKLESIPLDPDDSVYSKRISWVHMDTLIPLQVDYFTDGNEEPIKRMKINKIKKLQGNWTVLDSTMHDLESGHQTQMVIKAIKYDQQLPSSLFSRQALSDIRLEKKYRP